MIDYSNVHNKFLVLLEDKNSTTHNNHNAVPSTHKQNVIII